MDEQYKWIPISCTVVSFFAAFGIGANDVANAFATSVGSKALTMKQAIMIAGVMEFLGAFLLGGNVATTIMKGITEPEYFKDDQVTLMFGMLSVLIGVAVWLILATLYALPVSTTHSCIGGIIGMAIVSKGWKAVNWKQVGMVALSWIIAPVVSCILSVIFFVFIRKLILRSTNSLKRAFNFYSPIVAFTIALNIFIVLYKSSSLNIKLPMWQLIIICIFVGIIVAVVLNYTIMPSLRRRIEAEAQNRIISSNDNEMNAYSSPSEKGWVSTVDNSGDLVVVKSIPTLSIPLMDSSENDKLITSGLDKEGSYIAEMHKNAEIFDPGTEKLFGFLQIITAIFNSFAHGANDVANSIGPLASCITIYKTGDVMQDAAVPLYVLILGGLGIIVGLASLGYKVMASIGINMVMVTPSRGFAIEIGSAFVIIIGSALGLPLSTTHSKIGSTVGVGLVEGKNGVNWKLLYGVFAGWIVTIFICAIFTGVIFALGNRFLIK